MQSVGRWSSTRLGWCSSCRRSRARKSEASHSEATSGCPAVKRRVCIESVFAVTHDSPNTMAFVLLITWSLSCHHIVVKGAKIIVIRSSSEKG
jgi:hypothetical protein